MTYRPFTTFTLLALLVALAPVALASTTWYVNGVNGSDINNCLSSESACKTIGHAISLTSSGDSIMVAAATYTENLTITISLSILGSGAQTTVIDGGGASTVIRISSATARVTLAAVTIRNGLAAFGGGISNIGTLTVNQSTVTGNRAFSSIRLNSYGGGIANAGTLTINDSTISGNAAYAGYIGVFGSGGGIYGAATINNSTISGNSATGHAVYSKGGGIYGGGSINNSTISGNSAAEGGGIYGVGTTTLQNSIVANSFSSGNCTGTMVSNGHNLSSDGSCNFNGPGDMNNINPDLGPLQNNGGPTPTMALLTGSLAIDGGNPAGCTDGLGHLLKTDQRGMPRPDPEDSAGCDIGAYESQSD